jgi:hypothetical protein
MQHLYRRAEKSRIRRIVLCGWALICSKVYDDTGHACHSICNAIIERKIRDMAPFWTTYVDGIDGM